MTDQDLPEHVDLLVVGSGPVGAALARRVHDTDPAATILMAELGPALTERAGTHLRTVAPAERAPLQAMSQGRDPATGPHETGALVRKYADPGTHLVRARDDAESEQDGMPAAVMSSNVGGMGAHWAGACPRTLDSECVPYVPAGELDDALKVAEELLAVTDEAFDDTPAARLVTEKLSALFDPRYPEGRWVGPMPLSVARDADGGLEWFGADHVLGPLADPASRNGRFHLSSETICRRVLFDGERMTGAVVEHLPTGRQTHVRANAVAVAADALRTPQLLWASGIRPDALGRYLNDQPKTLSSLQVRDAPVAGAAAKGTVEFTGDVRDLETGRLWIPFADPEPSKEGHLNHGQAMLMDSSPLQGDDGVLLLALIFYGAKELSRDDRVEFSTSEADAYGMPKMTIHYSLTDRDRAGIARAIADQEAIAAELGDFLPGQEPALFPAGSSKHYQGTVRMGAADDGTSVCDSSSRVWGFENLYVGGNGVIPTSIACNPTLTSVALAVRAADAISGQLARDRG
jgi:pyranose oxidase